MGTLQLNSSPSTSDATELASSSIPQTDGTSLSAASAEAPQEAEATVRMHGKKLSTDTAIVLENVAAGFKRPNILDVKLGSRLWADDAPPSKRAKCDQVTAETTSGSLGFRIAGMRVWQGPQAAAARSGKGGEDVQSAASGEEGKGGDCVSFDAVTGYKVYNKLYGRRFGAGDVREGFREYLVVEGAGIDKSRAKMLADLFAQHTRNIERILAEEESRMYSASILFVYEGDAEAMAEVLDEKPQLAHSIEAANGSSKEASKEEEDSDGGDSGSDEEEEEPPRIVAVKMIDFAHAMFVPGQGPDENVLKGVRNVRKIFEDLSKKV